MNVQPNAGIAAVGRNLNFFPLPTGEHMLSVIRSFKCEDAIQHAEPIRTLSVRNALPMLKKGQACRWGNWTLSTSPAQQVLTDDGIPMWVSTLLVTSNDDLASFTPVNPSSIESAMRFIQSKQAAPSRVSASLAH